MTLTLTDIPYQLLLEVSTSVKITERESFLVFYMFFFFTFTVQLGVNHTAILSWLR